jgi:hypothetical protein
MKVSSLGFVNFGLLLWLPGELISEGRNMGVAAAIIGRDLRELESSQAMSP